MVEDFGGKESVVLNVVLENHGRSLARVSSIEMIIRTKVEEGMPFEELPVEILPLKKDSLKDGALEIRGKEHEQVKLSDRDLRELIDRQYGNRSRKLKIFKDSTRDRGFEISVKSNMDGRGAEVVAFFTEGNACCRPNVGFSTEGKITNSKHKSG